MNADRAAQLVHLIVVGKNRAAVSIAAQRLSRKEGGGGNLSEGTAALALIGGAKALGGVLNEK